MSNRFIDKRIKELEIDLNWIEYNLKNVSGISNMLFSVESATRINILGKKTYLNKYLKSPYGANSEYQRSLAYNRSAEETIVNLRNNIHNRLEKIKSIK